MMSLPAMCFEDRFCFSRKGGRWVGAPKGCKQHAESGLSLETTWLALGGQFLSFLA